MLYNIIRILIAGSALTACQFTPLMKPNVNFQKQSFDVYVKGEGYLAYRFRRELERQLAILPEIYGKSVRLDATISESATSTVSAIDATTNRMQTTLSSTYILTYDGQAIGTDTLEATTSYPINSVDEFVTKTSQNAAVNRTAKLLSEDLSREIMMRLKQKSSCQK